MSGTSPRSDGNRTVWYQDGGASGTRPNSIAVQVTPPLPYVLRKTMPRVAVLFGPHTASSGEATAISFLGRPDTRSFGLPTYGLSTANAGYRLRDGAVLNLTVATDADRTGHLYGEEIQPDTTVADALAAALPWVEAAPVCRS